MQISKEGSRKGNPESKEDRRLRHYISVDHLLTMLSSKHLRLQYSKSWEDQNDVQLLDTYRRSSAKSALVLICMTGTIETAHHWSRYGGSKKIHKTCIVFNHAKLRKSLKSGLRKINMGPPRGILRVRKIRYLKISQLYKERGNAAQLELPFIKRHQFQDERESRFLWDSKTVNKSVLKIPISLDCIDEIIISPWASKRSYNMIRNRLKNTLLRASIEKIPYITHSTLLLSKRWVDACRQAAIPTKPKPNTAPISIQRHM